MWLLLFITDLCNKATSNSKINDDVNKTNQHHSHLPEQATTEVSKFLSELRSRTEKLLIKERDKYIDMVVTNASNDEFKMYDAIIEGTDAHLKRSWIGVKRHFIRNRLKNLSSKLN